MKTLLLSGVLCLGLAGYPGTSLADTAAPADAQQARWASLILGTWSSDSTLPEGRIQGTTTYSPDGLFEGNMLVHTKGRRIIMRFMGKWQLENGHLVTSLISVTPPLLPLETVYRDQVISINADKIITRNEDGETEEQTRVSASPLP